MAFNIEFPDDFLSDLLDTDFSEIAEDALKEAAPIVESSMKNSLKRVISHDGESELQNSIKASKPKEARTDAWIVNVGPSGQSKTKTYKSKKGKNRKYPVSNALKAIWLEHGIPGQQAPKPFIQSAVNDAEEKVIKKIQEVYEKKVGAD
ncbi:MAG: HK97 gp10 family phage protein [Bacilli bacterium]|nr:HK97 gp10 family phage protein [Bacilli bacterium]